MKELNLKSVDVVKLALVVGVLYLIVSFIVLLLIFLVVGGAFAPFAFAPFGGEGLLAFSGLGFLLVIVGPIFYFILTFVIMLIVGLLLNLSLSITGGLPLRFKE